MNYRKGNHRRKWALANVSLGVAGNTCNTPSITEEELLIYGLFKVVLIARLFCWNKLEEGTVGT